VSDTILIAVTAVAAVLGLAALGRLLIGKGKG
jgi:hypothetical protein